MFSLRLSQNTVRRLLHSPGQHAYAEPAPVLRQNRIVTVESRQPASSSEEDANFRLDAELNADEKCKTTDWHRRKGTGGFDVMHQRRSVQEGTAEWNSFLNTDDPRAGPAYVVDSLSGSRKDRRDSTYDRRKSFLICCSRVLQMIKSCVGAESMRNSELNMALGFYP